MPDYKIITPSDTPIIVHTISPKFEAWLEGEDKDPKDWVGSIKWIDDVPEDEKANWRREANEWYYQQVKDGLI
mgnify:CR=1 FL=1